ncbi:MAG: toll/interleukin-1 receptor domain-containing protein [Candidatus Diapherotrites archaeon]|nr:toll/interleukin-1 receptor domain-containing protein [Candidatus Diapherotrites archaeon]
MTAVKKRMEAGDIMPNINYVGFHEESVSTILEALKFARIKFAEITRSRLTNASPETRAHIAAHWKEVRSKIEKAMEDAKDWSDKTTILDSDTVSEHKEVVKSALKVYHDDLVELRAKSPSQKLTIDIQESERIMSLEALTQTKSDIFDQFTGTATARLPFVFISHHHNDKHIAKVLKEYLAQVNIVGFVAHEDIVDDKPWNPQITEKLEESTHVFVIVTGDFHRSTYGNQEVGFAHGQLRKAGIPEITHFCFEGKRPSGMLFELQATDINESNFHKIVSEKINRALGMQFEFTEVALPSPLFSPVQEADENENLVDFKQLLEGLSHEAQANAISFSHNNLDEIRPIAHDLLERKGEILESFLRKKNLMKDYIALLHKIRTYNQNISKNIITKWVVLDMQSLISGFLVQLNESK